eukprot:6962943-Pyramimonas_sp.AAC.1
MKDKKYERSCEMSLQHANCTDLRQFVDRAQSHFKSIGLDALVGLNEGLSPNRGRTPYKKGSSTADPDDSRRDRRVQSSSRDHRSYEAEGRG